MITWPWLWKKRALALEAELAEAQHTIRDLCVEVRVEREFSAKQTTQLLILQEQVRRMSER